MANVIKEVDEDSEEEEDQLKSKQTDRYEIRSVVVEKQLSGQLEAQVQIVEDGVAKFYCLINDKVLLNGFGDLGNHMIASEQTLQLESEDKNPTYVSKPSLDSLAYEKDIEKLKGLILNLKIDLDDAIDLRDSSDESERDALENQVIKIGEVLKEHMTEIQLKIEDLEKVGLIEFTSNDQVIDDEESSQNLTPDESPSKSMIDENVRLLAEISQLQAKLQKMSINHTKVAIVLQDERLENNIGSLVKEKEVSTLEHKG